MTARIAIVDYGVGNIHSVRNALNGLGYVSLVTDRRDEIARADALILPGVGAFEEAMRNIRSRDLLGILAEQALERRKPVLGICLGMQILAEESEENGRHEGLGWIPGRVKRLQAPAPLRVPHVGWNEVECSDRDVFFSNASRPSPAFYYDHSYQLVCGPECLVAKSDYGGDVTAIVRKDNIYGVQFHPEKSQVNGARLLRSFFDHLKISHASAC